MNAKASLRSLSATSRICRSTSPYVAWAERARTHQLAEAERETVDGHRIGVDGPYRGLGLGVVGRQWVVPQPKQRIQDRRRHPVMVFVWQLAPQVADHHVAGYMYWPPLTE
jgi:hypothetical protein